MRNTMSRWTTTAAAAALLAGCASAAEDPAPYGRAEDDAPRYAVVENNSFETVRVYAVRGSTRFRLATITSLDSERIELEASMFQGGGLIRLMVDPLASRRPHVTDRFLMRPGEVVELRVHNHLPLTSYAVLAYSDG